MKSRGILVAACLIGLLGGCGHEVDESAWKSDLADQGVTPDDWAGYTSVWRDTCSDNEHVFELFVAQLLDTGTERAVIRTDIEHACPDRLEVVESML